MPSRLLVFTAETGLFVRVEATLAPYGWVCDHNPDTDAAVDGIVGYPPEACVIDYAGGKAEALIAALRALPAPLNGTPVLAVGDGADPMGPGGNLAAPLSDEALLGLLRRWAGPLRDHAFRESPWSFHYRLVRLVGLDSAGAMLVRLRQALSEAMTVSDSGDGPVTAHRLAGVAGVYGFAELSAAWSRVDRGEAEALPDAIAASRLVVAELDRALAAVN